MFRKPFWMLALFAVLSLAAAVPALRADKRAVMPVKQWSGSVADHTLQKQAPEVITKLAVLKKLWDEWKITDQMPMVDFTKELVVVTTTRGSRLKLHLTLDDANGDFTVSGFATRDLRPGFRYVIATVSREGVKTVNGKKLP